MRPTILIADDQIEQLETLQLFLEDEYDILQATDVEHKSWKVMFM
jgi:PleD family two-component response regulator